MIKKITKEIIKILILLFILLLILFPLYILLITSLKSNYSTSNNNYSLILKEFEWSNFNFFKNSIFWKAVFLSMSSSLLLICLRVVFYTLFIVGLSKINQKIKKAILLFIMFFSFIPEFSIYLSLREILSNFHIINNLSVFSIVSNSIFSYFFIYNLLINFEKTKNQYWKVIKLDNLNIFQKIYLVYWKEMRNYYILLIIFSFISSWNDYLWPNFLLSSTDSKTVGIWFRQIGETPSGGYFLNIQAAGSLVVILLPLGIYFTFSQKIIKF
ncbi:ABC transporter permease subunit [Mycoplasma sp. 480]|uniref:ABC transporter permease subunit n=1 Tax=Mycoplasma sp. 480 TaxID=3440155 RepID=UPI003F515A8B